MLDKVQLDLISKVLNNLNHYQVLKVSPVASDTEIQNAFHREALDLHPDQYFSMGDPELLELSKRAYSRVVEAYRTLTDSSKRREYDASMGPQIKGATTKLPPDGLSGPDFDDDNATTSVRTKPTTSAAGARFYKLAHTALISKDLNSAKMNIQLAINADPANPEYIQFSHRLEQELKRVKK